MGKKIRTFNAVLQKIPEINATYICLPFDATEEYGRRHMIKVKATIDGVLYRGSLVDMGMGTMLGVTQEIRKKIGKNQGDTVEISLESDLEKRTVEIPEDAVEIFNSNEDAYSYFSSLSYSNKKEYIRWITDAKREETRLRRLNQMILMLLEKKRNPFEK